VADDQKIVIVIQGEDRLTVPARQASTALNGLQKAAGVTTSSLSTIGGAANQASGGIGGLVNKVGMLGLAAQGVTMLAGAFVSLASGMVSGNAEFERYETQFGVLLGSTKAAKDRLEELTTFAAVTPFELPEVVRADKVLTAFGLDTEQTAKKFGVSAKQIRTTIGDAAAGSGASFEELAGTMGRFASGSTGEAIMRMQELGIATREQMTQWGMQFSKTGELLTPVDKAFGMLEKGIRARFGGMMDAQSQTFEGMVSNLQDWLGQTKRALMAPVFDVLKDQLKGLLAFLGSDQAKVALDNIGKTLASGVSSAIGFVTGLIGKVRDLVGYLDPGNKRDLMREWFGDAGPVIDNIVRGIKSVVSAITELAGSADLSSFGIKLQQLTGINLFPLANWLGTTIPAAIQTMSGLWTGTLQPAIQTVVGFITGTVIPALSSVWNWLQTAIPAAITAVSGFWTSTLLPAIQSVAAFATGTVIPALASVVAWLETNVPAAVNAAANVLTGTLIPAFTQVTTWIGTNIPAAAQTTANVFNTSLLPAFQGIANVFSQYIIPLGDAVIGVLGALGNLLVTTLTPAVNWLWARLTDVAKVISDALTPALNAASAKGGPLDALATAFQWVLDRVRDLTNLLRDLEATINRIGGRNVAGVNVDISGNSAGRAAGGPVFARQSYIVGERRPEIFTPSSNGYITPRVPSGGGGLSIGTIYITGAATVQDVQQGIVGAARSLGLAVT
jgi:hypothetical protein